MFSNFSLSYLSFFLILIIGGGLLVFLKSKLGESKLESKYSYLKKEWFMSKAEHECFNALMQAVGTEFYIFPQVHLATLLDHKIKGQNWQGALSHIDRKSVDFVLCDKNYLSPKLAIELDDSTHLLSDRKNRDEEVEAIFKAAGMPLLRIENHGKFDPAYLAQQIRTSLI